MEILFVMTCVLSFAVSVMLGKVLIPWLHRLRAGQSILKDGPTWHAAKEGTPTMGGVMFIASTFLTCVVCGWGEMMVHHYLHLCLFLFAVVFGLIGFLDDFKKVKQHQNLGLTAWQKLVLQFAAAIAFLCVLRFLGYLSPNVYVPFFQVEWILPWPLYLALATFAIVGTVNAVNLTDGVDGLATCVTIPPLLFFTVFAAVWPSFEGCGFFSAALLGGLIGFLLFNRHPAKVFMGDTGSLFLGGAIAGLAFAFDMPLILLLVGFVYFCEAMSDIIQVTYFKLTHGKRVFKMAPLHHHFEMCGWSENKVVCVFTAVSLAFCLLAYCGVCQRFFF